MHRLACAALQLHWNVADGMLRQASSDTLCFGRLADDHEVPVVAVALTQILFPRLTPHLLALALSQHLHLPSLQHTITLATRKPRLLYHLSQRRAVAPSLASADVRFHLEGTRVIPQSQLRSRLQAPLSTILSPDLGTRTLLIATTPAQLLARS